MASTDFYTSSSDTDKVSSVVNMGDQQEQLHFDVHVSVIFQLGESLITDEIQALIELIKNCYDANASYANVVVDTHSSPPNSTRFSGSTGYLSIEDDGDGMTRDTIVRGWLTISNSLKREAKIKAKTQPLPLDQRTPLGDKGLGRLGAQRLGAHIEVWTRSIEEEVEHYLAVSWLDFTTKERLSEVPIVLETTPNPVIFTGKDHGTRIVISGFSENDLESWRDSNKNSSDLQRRLSQMLSPYSDVARFQVVVTVDGTSLELTKMADKVRGLSQLHYEIKFDGQTFSSVGKTKLAYFRPEKKEELLLWNQMLAQDAGQGFFEFLSTKYRPNVAQSFGLKRALNEDKKPSDVWFVEYSYRRDFENFPGLLLTTGEANTDLANPGSFSGRVDYFNLGAQSAAQQNVFDRASAYKEFIRTVNGIRVYRDGFAVRVDTDWLKLGKQQTSGASFYGLRPDNTLGYIAISARDNQVLEETTDREGFKETPHYLNFWTMLQAWVKWTGSIQEFLRRGWTEYGRHLAEVAAKNPTNDNQPSTPSAQEIGRRLTKTLASAGQYTKPLKDLVATVDLTVANAQKTLIDVVAHGDSASGKALQSAIADLQTKSVEVRNTLSQIENYLNDVARNASLSQVLTNQIEVLREQLAEVHETVSLGLTAEVLSHDIHLVTDQLVTQTKNVRAHLKRRNIRDVEITTYVSNVDSSINSLLKQLSRLTPAMRYLREKKEEIDVAKFCDDEHEHFRSRFDNRNIQMELATGKGGNFKLHMNRGKLVQVVDNLLLNSEYWMREEIRLGRIQSGLVRIEISKPFIYVHDNGPGIDTALENTLFEPFITNKPKEAGRGLGLYIVQQLLDSENCAISLVPPRNARGRLNTFAIDFSGALTD